MVAAEGRHYLRSHTDKYDLIEINSVDTLSALSSGAPSTGTANGDGSTVVISARQRFKGGPTGNDRSILFVC